jgi:hypothetical protein
MQHTSDASIASFAEVARGYCTWCEGDSLGPDPESQAAGWLARLYAGALVLPDRDAENSEGLPDLPQPHADRAKANLAPFQGWYYREFFDPHPHLTDESCMGDVGDDLLDIYLDVRAGLVSFDSGDVNDAAWHWSFLYRIHWGRHAVGGLFALHCMHVSKRE